MIEVLNILTTRNKDKKLYQNTIKKVKSNLTYLMAHYIINIVTMKSGWYCLYMNNIVGDGRTEEAGRGGGGEHLQAPSQGDYIL